LKFSFQSLAKPSLHRITAYQPGKPIEEVKRELGVQDVIKLASNENALGPSHFALTAAQNALLQVALYPDGSGYELKDALSQYLGVLPGQITLGAGSDEVMAFVAQAFVRPEHEVIISEYAFATYTIIAHLVEANPIIVPAKNWEHDLAAMAAAITTKTRLVFIANPNNPTGGYIPTETLECFLKKIPPHVLVISDEAYYEYVTVDDYPDTLNLQRKYPNLITTRTFSKIYGLAGLRIGYGISHPDIAAMLERVRLPFNLSIPALAAAYAALQDQVHVQRTLAMTQQGLTRLKQGLDRLGLHYLPTTANFLLVDLKRPVLPIHAALLNEGVIIRPLANYGMPECLRVTAGLPEENERFLNAIEKVLGASL